MFGTILPRLSAKRLFIHGQKKSFVSVHAGGWVVFVGVVAIDHDFHTTKSRNALRALRARRTKGCRAAAANGWAWPEAMWGLVMPVSVVSIYYFVAAEGFERGNSHICGIPWPIVIHILRSHPKYGVVKRALSRRYSSVVRRMVSLIGVYSNPNILCDFSLA